MLDSSAAVAVASVGGGAEERRGGEDEEVLAGPHQSLSIRSCVSPLLTNGNRSKLPKASSPGCNDVPVISPSSMHIMHPSVPSRHLVAADGKSDLSLKGFSYFDQKMWMRPAVCSTTEDELRNFVKSQGARTAGHAYYPSVWVE